MLRESLALDEEPLVLDELPSTKSKDRVDADRRCMQTATRRLANTPWVEPSVGRQGVAFLFVLRPNWDDFGVGWRPRSPLLACALDLLWSLSLRP